MSSSAGSLYAGPAFEARTGFSYADLPQSTNRQAVSLKPCTACAEREVPCTPGDSGEPCSRCRSLSCYCSHVVRQSCTKPLPQKRPQQPEAGSPAKRRRLDTTSDPLSTLPSNARTSLTASFYSASMKLFPLAETMNALPILCTRCAARGLSCTTFIPGRPCMLCFTDENWSCSLAIRAPCNRCESVDIDMLCEWTPGEPCAACVRAGKSCAFPRPQCEECTERSDRGKRVRCKTPRWGVPCTACSARGDACSLVGLWERMREREGTRKKDIPAVYVALTGSGAGESATAPSQRYSGTAVLPPQVRAPIAASTSLKPTPPPKPASPPAPTHPPKLASPPAPTLPPTPAPSPGPAPPRATPSAAIRKPGSISGLIRGPTQAQGPAQVLRQRAVAQSPAATTAGRPAAHVPHTPAVQPNQAAPAVSGRLPVGQASSTSSAVPPPTAGPPAQAAAPASLRFHTRQRPVGAQHNPSPVRPARPVREVSRDPRRRVASRSVPAAPQAPGRPASPQGPLPRPVLPPTPVSAHVATAASPPASPPVAALSLAAQSPAAPAPAQPAAPVVVPAPAPTSQSGPSPPPASPMPTPASALAAGPVPPTSVSVSTPTSVSLPVQPPKEAQVTPESIQTAQHPVAQRSSKEAVANPADSQGAETSPTSVLPTAVAHLGQPADAPAALVSTSELCEVASPSPPLFIAAADHEGPPAVPLRPSLALSSRGVSPEDGVRAQPEQSEETSAASTAQVRQRKATTSPTPSPAAGPEQTNESTVLDQAHIVSSRRARVEVLITTRPRHMSKEAPQLAPARPPSVTGSNRAPSPSLTLPLFLPDNQEDSSEEEPLARRRLLVRRPLKRRRIVESDSELSDSSESSALSELSDSSSDSDYETETPPASPPSAPASPRVLRPRHSAAQAIAPPSPTPRQPAAPRRPASAPGPAKRRRVKAQAPRSARHPAAPRPPPVRRAISNVELGQDSGRPVGPMLPLPPVRLLSLLDIQEPLPPNPAPASQARQSGDRLEGRSPTQDLPAQEATLPCSEPLVKAEPELPGVSTLLQSSSEEGQADGGGTPDTGDLADNERPPPPLPEATSPSAGSVPAAVTPPPVKVEQESTSSTSLSGEMPQAEGFSGLSGAPPALDGEQVTPRSSTPAPVAPRLHSDACPSSTAQVDDAAGHTCCDTSAALAERVASLEGTVSRLCTLLELQQKLLVERAS